MNSIHKLGLFGALALLACATLVSAADEPGELTLDQMKLRQAKKGDTATLRIVLPPDLSLQTVNMTSDALRISLGETTVFELPPPGSRQALRARHIFKWKYRGENGSRMTIDLSKAKIKLVAKRQDLAEVVESGSSGVKVRVELAGRSWESVVDVKRRRRVLKLARPVGPAPPDGNSGIDIGFTVHEIANGWMSGVSRPDNSVARTPAQWQAMWDRHQSNLLPPAPLPSVDFSEEMVIAVFLGDRPDPSHSVSLRRVTSGDGDLLVLEYDDTRVVDSNCAFPAVIAQPFLLLRTPRYDAVKFGARIVQADCGR